MIINRKIKESIIEQNTGPLLGEYSQKFLIDDVTWFEISITYPHMLQKGSKKLIDETANNINHVVHILAKELQKNE